MEFLTGIIERITFENEENGFSVIKIKSRGFQDLVTIVGNMASVNIGAIVKLQGDWKYDSKFGKQFCVHTYAEIIPATVAGIEKYLGSGLIKGIGPVNARRIVNKFKEDTIRIIEEDTDRLIEVGGIGNKRVQIIKKAWQEQKEIKNVMLFLQSHGVSTSYSVKIYKTYGNESIKIVKENPFRLADDIWGIGFKTADKIAQNMGFDANSFERCRSGTIYVLNELSNDGHCFATKEQLIEEAVKMLELTEENVSATLEKMIAEKSVILDYENSIYLPAFYYSEVGVAKRIKEIVDLRNNFVNLDINKIISQIQEEYSIKYDDVQIEAIKVAANSKFMILTGGPGTGKTTTTLAIIKIFEKMGCKVLLTAPTGRAAKRMSETTGMEAKTIHRLLEYKPPEGYKKNAENPIGCDVLIIDESSMIDIILMYNLLKAVPNDTIIILVGDIDQLPSVGAGNVLKDIIDSGIVSVVRLTRIFRQASSSMIITNAHKINKGEFPNLKGRKDSDFFFIESEPEEVINNIKELCTKRLPGYFKVNPIEDIQVLCPMQRGEAGAVNLNMILQETLNNSDVSIKYGGTNFKLNDKVMQIKNNYDKNVFNGDLGRIVNIDTEEKTVNILFDKNEVEYDITEMDEIVLAYATTIHKSQGSEYKIVIAPFVMQHYMMLQRNLLYTCITRAKKAIVLVGSIKAIGYSVRNNKTILRNTMLSKRLAE